MDGRERVARTLAHRPVDRLPRELWMVPYIWQFRGEELKRLNELFPGDTAGPDGIRYGPSGHARGTPFRVGRWTDEFGSGWEALEDGVAGEVKDPPIRTRADLDRYRLPWEMLDGFDASGQAEAYRATDRYVKAGTHVRPFERLQFLRGSEQLFLDIATEDPIFLELNERLHEFALRELRLVCAQAVDGVSFMDDWGSQRALLISPAAWRKHFGPLYREYCALIRAAGKHVFFHSDGHIEAIFGDLADMGVHAVNSQLFCMDMEGLGRRYAGRVAFWGELDRQAILPFGSERDVREGVRRMGRALLRDGPRTGLFAELSWETVTPFRNVAAAFDEFGKL